MMMMKTVSGTGLLVKKNNHTYGINNETSISSFSVGEQGWIFVKPETRDLRPLGQNMNFGDPVSGLALEVRGPDTESIP